MSAIIPPEIATIGPIEAVLPDLVARVAANLHADASDEWVIGAVDAAVTYVIRQTNRAEIGLPDDFVTRSGIVGFATRIYLDAYHPNGATTAFADDTFVPLLNPSALWKHWRDYFTQLYRRWGIA